LNQILSMKENSFTINKTARYYTIGDLKTAKNILIVLHGYGQLAYYFSKKFEFLSRKNYFIIAPEGTHRFYLEGTSGRVGASWMTKEARLLDINNNENYLEDLTTYFHTKNTSAQIHVLGFSQGAATATRWFEKSKLNIASLILWASVFPDDVSIKIQQHKNTNLIFVLGSKDPYFNEEMEHTCLNIYQSMNFEIIRFEGKHELIQHVLESIFT